MILINEEFIMDIQEKIIARYEVIYYWVFELKTSIKIKSFSDMIWWDRLCVNDFEEKPLQNIQMMVEKSKLWIVNWHTIMISSKTITSYGYDWQNHFKNPYGLKWRLLQVKKIIIQKWFKDQRVIWLFSNPS